MKTSSVSSLSPYSRDHALHGADFAAMQDLLCDAERAEVCEHAADLSTLQPSDVDALAARDTRPLHVFSVSTLRGFAYVLAHDERESLALCQAKGLTVAWQERLTHAPHVFFESGPV